MRSPPTCRTKSASTGVVATTMGRPPESPSGEPHAVAPTATATVAARANAALRRARPTRRRLTVASAGTDTSRETDPSTGPSTLVIMETVFTCVKLPRADARLGRDGRFCADERGTPMTDERVL